MLPSVIGGPGGYRSVGAIASGYLGRDECRRNIALYRLRSARARHQSLRRTERCLNKRRICAYSRLSRDMLAASIPRFRWPASVDPRRAERGGDQRPPPRGKQLSRTGCRWASIAPSRFAFRKAVLEHHSRSRPEFAVLRLGNVTGAGRRLSIAHVVGPTRSLGGGYRCSRVSGAPAHALSGGPSTRSFYETKPTCGSPQVKSLWEVRGHVQKAAGQFR
jgi:hypothetical protein